MRHFNIFAPGRLRQSLNADICGCFRQSLGLSVYQGRMILRTAFFQPLLRAASAAAMLAIAAGLGGCADMSDTLSTAFADPAKYDLYNCKQLETERKNRHPQRGVAGLDGEGRYRRRRSGGG
jgi:hypothetical protein